MRPFLSTLLLLLLVSCAQAPEPRSGFWTLSIVGTNDVHGELLREQNSGGIVTLSGYVAALRAARAADGGAVLLIDAGDMWQGTLESNLVEGKSMVDAYNALGYDAVTIGNHEFDFGPLGPLAIPAGPGDDPRGALRQRISEAKFPVLSANIVDTATGNLIDWQNVTPSVLLDVGGIRVGIIGLITANALNATIAANGVGLEIAPLAEAAIREARSLRAQGASLVIVTAHAGGRCRAFDDPLDLSSCDANAEILQVARALPRGLVDHIVAGHVHQGMAHEVNGVSITSSFSSTYAFDRVDFRIDRADGRVVQRVIYPPQVNCPAFFIADDECAWLETDPALVRQAIYEGRPVMPMAAVRAVADEAQAYTAAIKSESLGVNLRDEFNLNGNPESTLGNLFTRAILEEVDGDVVIHNVSGGIRSNLPAGEVTYGRIFDIFPFDNRVAVLDISGAQLRRIVAVQAARQGRRAGISGMRVLASCENGAPNIEMMLDDGRRVADEDRLRLIANDFLVTGGDSILAPGMPDGGYQLADDPRFVRDVLVQWFRRQGASLGSEEFSTAESPRWRIDPLFVAQCQHGI